MGFLDNLTGKNQAKAQQKTATLLDQNRQFSLGQIAEGSNIARQDVVDGFGNARKDINTGFNTARADLSGASTNALNSLGGGFNQARTDITGGGTAGLGEFDRLEQLGGRFGNATNLFLDSTGANGADGNQRAVDAFQTGPGFNFARDQGIDAISRRRAAQGLNDSGNADRDATVFATGLANQEFGNFQNRLAQFPGLEAGVTGQVASGRAGIQGQQGTNLANLSAQQGQLESGVNERLGGGLAGIATNAFNNQAQFSGQQGLSLAELANSRGLNAANINGQFSGPIADTITNAAAARGAGAANLANLGLNAGKLLAGGF